MIIASGDERAYRVTRPRLVRKTRRVLRVRQEAIVYSTDKREISLSKKSYMKRILFYFTRVHL